jgi:6-phosphogluconolactonase/glucosamine-6-phosphate isomerase/deaminase
MHIKPITYPGKVSEMIGSAIQAELAQGKRVAWLLCGGSCVPIAFGATLHIPANPNLMITLTDERYGRENHRDSNWKALRDVGFPFGWYDSRKVLNWEQPVEETLDNYGKTLGTIITSADVVFALFGMGADGHIAGILPHSPAVEHNGNWVVGYQSDPYYRMTMTEPVFHEIDHAFLYTEGETKKKPLNDLRQNIAIADQPAQLIKLTKSFTLLHKA